MSTRDVPTVAQHFLGLFRPAQVTLHYVLDPRTSNKPSLTDGHRRTALWVDNPDAHAGQRMANLCRALAPTCRKTGPHGNQGY